MNRTTYNPNYRNNYFNVYNNNMMNYRTMYGMNIYDNGMRIWAFLKNRRKNLDTLIKDFQKEAEGIENIIESRMNETNEDEETMDREAERVSMYYDYAIQMLEDASKDYCYMKYKYDEAYSKVKLGTGARYVYDNIFTNSNLQWLLEYTALSAEDMKVQLLNCSKTLFVISYIIKNTDNRVLAESLITSLTLLPYPTLLSLKRIEEKTNEILKSKNINYFENNTTLSDIIGTMKQSIEDEINKIENNF